MKYSKEIVIFSLLALLLCVVCRYIFIVNDANIKEKQLYAYVWNRTDNCCSEIGLVGIEKIEHCNLLTRTF